MSQLNATSRVVLLLSLAGFGHGSGLAQQPATRTAAPVARAPITHEALWLTKRVGAPVPSPDGRWAVFTLTEPSYQADQQVTDLWLVPTDGSAAPRRLTSTKAGESGAAWSPDGRRLAFSARREGDDVAQVYVLDVAGGGEAQRVTSVALGARSPQWSPDGSMLLFASAVYPGAVLDSANRRIAGERRQVPYRVRVYDNFPIRNWDRWLDDTRQTLLVQRAEPGAEPKNLLSGTGLAAEPGFGGSMGSGSEQLEAAWAPDGRSVVFAATADRHKSAYASGTMALYRVELEGGEPVRITRPGWSYSNPTFSPDGARLYALTSPDNGRIYNHSRLAVLSWPAGGEPRVLSADIDRSISTIQFSPDGRTLFYTGEGAGVERIYALPATGGAERVVTPRSTGVYTGLAVAGVGNAPVLLANWQSAERPPELVRIDARTGEARALTSYNVAMAERTELTPVEHFWFASSRGDSIHNLIVRPPNFEPQRKYPLFVLMHGGPNSMWRDEFHLRWNYHMFAAPGYVVLLTNYSGSTGFGEKFAQAIQQDPLAGPAQEINEAADEAIRRYPFIDATRQAAGGASYGGHLAYWQQGVTTRYRTLIAHAGAMNMESQWGTSDVIWHREVNFGGPVWEQGPIWREQNPIRRAARFRTPMLLSVGERDYRVPMNVTLEAWSVLQRLQIPSRLVIFPDENHWVLSGENSRFFYRTVTEWLGKYLGN